MCSPKLLPALLSLLIIFFGCKQAEPESENAEESIYNTIVAGKLAHYDARFHDNTIVLSVGDIVADDYTQFLSKIQPDGTFQFAVDLQNVQEISLKYKKFFRMLAQPGDSIYVSLTIDPETERATLEEFSGSHAERNQWVHDYAQISKQNIFDNPLPQPYEVSFPEYFDALQAKKAVQDSSYTDFVGKHNIQDTLFFAWAHQVNLYKYAYAFFSFKAMNELHQRIQAKKNNPEANVSIIPVNIEAEKTIQKVLDTMLLYQKDMLISESLVGFYDVFDTYFWSNAHIYHKEKYGGDNKNIYSSRLEYLNETFYGDNKELMVSRFLYGTLLNVKNLYIKNSDREELKERREELLALVEENLPNVQHPPFKAKLSEYLAEMKAYHAQLDTTAYVSESLNLSQYPDGERFWNELISTHHNKVLYVKFWAPWCGPCMGDWPAIEKLGSRLQDEDFAVINLCFNTKREHWEKAIAKYNISGNNYLLTGDQTNILKNTLNFSAIPHQIIVDKAGNIADNNAHSPHGKGGTLNPILMDQLMALIQNQE